MVLHRAPGIAHCVFDDCTIVLDIDRDRYWRVDREIGAALDRLAQWPVEPPASAVVRRLLRLGLAIDVADDRPAPAGADLPAPIASALESLAPQSSVTTSDLLATATDLLRARWLLRYRPLKRLLATRAASVASASSDIVALGELARRFAACQRLTPVKSRCLPDSLAFLDFAARRGQQARLVFGVTAHPFAAHCWVQADDLILNDALGHVTTFSRILVA